MNRSRAFTIVELLIVIVVVGVLAAISIVAYNNIAAKARDAQRMSDISSITKALELYYIENGAYPPGSWAYSDTASWDTFISALGQFGSGISSGDPINQRGSSSAQSAYIYSYFTNTSGSPTTPGYCGVTGIRQMYILTYRLESGEFKREPVGECLPVALQYSQSWYRSAKH